MTYTVQNGDTIETIAARMGTSAELLMERNHLTIAEELMPGMVLVIEEERLWPESFDELPYCGVNPAPGQPINSCFTQQTLAMEQAQQSRTVYEVTPTNLLDYTKPTPPPPGWEQNQPSKPTQPQNPGRPQWPNNRPPWPTNKPGTGTIIIYPNNSQGNTQPGIGTPIYGEPNLNNVNYTWYDGTDLRYLLFTEKYRYRTGEQIAITFRKRNISKQSLALRYPSGQLFDFYISNQQGLELWRWSDGVAQSNIEREIILSPNQAEVMTVVWDQRTKTGQRVSPQRLTIWGVNLAGEIAIPLEIQIY